MFGLAPRSRTAPRQPKGNPTVAGKDGDVLVVGRRVRTHPKGLLGVVRWVGPTHFSGGTWVGVELDTPDGRNDGLVQGQRFFTCAPGHGVFVRPENCIALRGPGSTGVASASTTVADKRHPPAVDRTQTHHKGATASPTSERTGTYGFAYTASSSGIPTREAGAPSHAWGLASEVGGVRRANGRPADAERRRSNGFAGGADDQIIGRLLASEAFSRVVSVKVADRVRAELATRDSQAKSEQAELRQRMSNVDAQLTEATGAMDDIAAMVQTISDKVADGAAGAGEGDAQANGGGGDAGGGGGGGGGEGNRRDDTRVAELTKLLCTVHKMSSQAAELLRSERAEHQSRVEYLTGRLRDLERSNVRSNGGGFMSSVTSEPSEG